ncbi:dihydroxyacetone kinase subunit DhaL [Streptomyces sp. NBC_01218]|uniref:dihydroxyacetone kinase subunit DhaL n=1 Tax=unclassified Streptomyces TaxID=2593676 RepID=UPI0023B91D5A|nr:MULTISPECIES: dihydroxyacetone kinase subunit DhaL [unclassified Streptomyces]WEH38236.1 dihydroxyacetone kinase subunit DhaL [Streptomyces sp. AM 2-1-1]WSQ49897.1 dihydroxyacetone kinase subunit DhaL [Streptomyces sp. NBC_01218]
MTTPFDITFTSGWMDRFADSAHATETELTALDQQVGDGDFGVNLSAGVRATQRLRGEEGDAGGDGPSVPLGRAASAFLDEIGGTSGPLFGLLFQALSAAVAAQGPLLTTAALAAGTEDGLAAIRRVGDAKPGDKTLVDALTPAAEALRAAPEGTPPDQALALAADAAWQGVRNTAALRARMGRASYVGERASGIPDPGAVGVALLFASAAGTVRSLGPHVRTTG